MQIESESVTVQQVQQPDIKKCIISSHADENVSILSDNCKTTNIHLEKDLNKHFSEPETTQELESNVSHDTNNQTDLQTEDEIYQCLTKQVEETNFTENTQYYVDNRQNLTDKCIPENSTTPDNTELELLLYCNEL